MKKRNIGIRRVYIKRNNSNVPLLEVGLKQGFMDMSAQRAGKIGVFNTAESLLPLEKKAIDQGRLCQLASFSDYREYASFPRPRSFSDISKNKETVEFLEEAYNRVDDIEFYIGLFSEDPEGNSPLPPLMGRMVAVDAFSQAFTNPLLSRHVWNEETFTKVGWKTIHETNNLRDILQRNVVGGLGDDAFVGITHGNWKAS